MSSHHGLYAQGYTRATMGRTKGCYLVTGCQSQKPPLSSDCSLQLDYMKMELLVMASQQHRREYVPGSCTHRPSRHGSRQHLKMVNQLARGEAVEGGVGDWDEVVTR